MISYSNIEGGEEGVYQYGPDCELVWGEGNIVTDPLFCEADSGNYQLAANSPAVGTGINGWNMGADTLSTNTQISSLSISFM